MICRKLYLLVLFAIFAAQMLFSPSQAQSTDTQALAKQLANPVSNLISVPLQNTYNCCFGTGHAGRYTLNIQPVIPYKINTDWNLIVRTIIPVLYQQAPAPEMRNRFGMGDIVQSFFLSPVQEQNGMIWGLGPVFLWPTATSSQLGTEKWGAGPTGVMLKQLNGWTIGGLANHIWSYAGEEKRDNISASLIQPFISYTFPNTVGISLSTETTYDWTHQQWTVPINLGISKVFSFGKQHVSLGIAGQYFATKPAYGPDWGIRFTATFLFPK